MILGTVHRSPGIYLIAEQNLENLSYETIDEGCATSHRLQLDPLPPNEVGRIAQHVREGEQKKKRKG